MKSISLNRKRIVVTGGARGLGRAFAEAAVEAGASVVVADILEDVPVAVEPAGADPAAAFAAHLADIFGIPVHQRDQEMAADPG